MTDENVQSEYYCETHDKYFKDEKGMNVHLTKMHNDNAKIETVEDETEDFDIDSILEKIKISGIFELIFIALSKKYKDERFKLTEEEAELIDGAFADMLSMLPKKLMNRIKHIIPFFPIVLVILPIVTRRIGFAIDKPEQQALPQKENENASVQN